MWQKLWVISYVYSTSSLAMMRDASVAETLGYFLCL